MERVFSEGHIRIGKYPDWYPDFYDNDSLHIYSESTRLQAVMFTEKQQQVGSIKSQHSRILHSSWREKSNSYHSDVFCGPSILLETPICSHLILTA